LILCPVCFDRVDWRGLPLWRLVDGNYVPAADTSEPTEPLYVRCPNPAGDSPAHYLPAEYVSFGPPIVIGLVGPVMAGKTSLLAAQVQQIIAGGLASYGLSVRPFDQRSHGRFEDSKVGPYSRGMFLSGESVGKTRHGYDFALVVTPQGGASRLVFFYDPQGEDLNRQADGALRFLVAASGLMMLAAADRIVPAVASERYPGPGPASLDTKPVDYLQLEKPDIPVAIVVTKADRLRYLPEVGQWLRFPRPSGPLSADAVNAESWDILRMLQRAGIPEPWPSSQRARTSYHVVSASGAAPIPDKHRISSVSPVRVLQPLLSLFAMLGLLPGEDSQRFGLWSDDPALQRPVDLQPLPEPTAADLASLAPQPHAAVVSDAADSVDQLGLGAEVATIATLLAARSTALPVSLALLGEWGIGKSSFMAQTAAQVVAITKASARAPRDSAYVANIRQVFFNAWHYSDDQLWVGLIEHMFRELADELPPGAVAVEDVEQRLREAREAEAEATGQLGHVAAVDVDGWFGWLRKPVRALRLLHAVRRSAWREVRTRRNLGAGLALTLLGAVGIVLLMRFGAPVIAVVSATVAAFAGVLTPIVGIGRRVDDFVGQAKAALTARRDEAAQQAAHLEKKLAVADPARRLRALLADITTTGRYENDRGIVGRVHHDLVQLDQALGAARDQWERGGEIGDPPLQRIVLYVDDLDRCKADRVVEVLQAVNLLLSLPLFAVVVAVDPPWLIRALETHYGPGMLPAEHSRRRALNYLDKIFHLTYALGPPGPGGAESYLRALLPAATFVSEFGRTIPQHTEPDSEPSPDGGRDAVAPASPREDPAVLRPLPSAATLSDLSDQILYLTPAEHRFVPTLHPLLPTPRAIKKMANFYRLLRITTDDRLSAFLDEETQAYKAAAVLLATLIAAPGDARTLLTTVTRDGAASDVVALVTELDLQPLATWLRTSNAPRETTVYREWAPTIARFGIETYDLFRR
jgi:hypothetical protein